MYTPSAQPLSNQSASLSAALNGEATTSEALLGAPPFTRQVSSIGSIAQAFALTQACSTYYLTRSHSSIVVIGTRTLSVGGPVASIGTELVSIASTAIIVNGRSTIFFARTLATTTASNVPSVARASAAGPTNANEPESSKTDGTSPTAAKGSHITSSDGVWRFHQAPRGPAVALCFFVLVLHCG